MKVTCLLGILFLAFFKLQGQSVFLKGTVTDKNNKPLPFVSIWLADSCKGVVTNEKGDFNLHVIKGTVLTFRSPSYLPLIKSIVANDEKAYFQLAPSDQIISGSYALTADSMISLVIANRKFQKKQTPAYTGHLYAKDVQRLNDGPKTFLKKDIAHQLNLTSNRQGIISLSESISRYHTQSTGYIQEQVDAAKFTANSEAFNFNSAAELHVDFYKDFMVFNGLSDHSFVSPLARNAFNYYQYSLKRQFTDGNKQVAEIKVKPKRRDEHLFNGTIYIIEQDWVLYAVDMHLSPRNHIDFVDSVVIRQQFVPADNDNWVPQDMCFSFYGKLLKFKYHGYFLQVYLDVAKDTITRPASYEEVYHSSKENYVKDDFFWARQRPLPLLIDEDHFYRLTELAERHKKDKTVVDSLQNTNNRFRLLNYILNGYTLHQYSNKSAWAFPAPYNLFFYNTVEGFGIDAKVKYTQVYNNQRTLNIIPDARYGFADHILNTNVFANFIYNPYHQASVYGRIGSDFLDLNNTGTINPFINSLSTLLLGNNYIKLYQSRFIMGGTDGEIANGILLNGSVEYANRRSLLNTTQTFNKDSVYLTSNNPLDPNNNTPLFPEYRALTIRASATFTFDQQYKITPTGKYIMPNPYPRVRINYREGLPILGSDVNYNFLSIDVFQDHLNMGVYGYTAYFFSIGSFPNAHILYYPDYNQFSGGESFFFNASLGTFHFLNFYTYSTYKTYFQANIEHNFTGFFLSRVPLVNRLNLQEIVGGSYLTQGTLPNYKEVYIGLKRTAIRLDYGLAFGLFTSRVQGFRLSYNF